MTKHEIILAALAAAGEGVSFSPVQVQKLFFLIDREVDGIEGSPHFDFQPYDYGPFDRAVYDALDELSTEGMVETRNAGRYREYSLTSQGFEKGREKLKDISKQSEEAASHIMDTAKWVASAGFRQLVTMIYERYPEMRENSVFRG